MTELNLTKKELMKNKKQLINIFIKNCMNLSVAKHSIDRYFDIFLNNFPSNDLSAKNIKQKYNINEYVNRLSVFIDNYFTEKELENMIKFYSSTEGRKIINTNYFIKINSILEQMLNEAKQKITINKKEK